MKTTILRWWNAWVTMAGVIRHPLAATRLLARYARAIVQARKHLANGNMLEAAAWLASATSEPWIMGPELAPRVQLTAGLLDSAAACMDRREMRQARKHIDAARRVMRELCALQDYGDNAVLQDEKEHTVNEAIRIASSTEYKGR